MAQVTADALEAALRSPIVVEQAAGILAARYDVDLPRAFVLLQRGARSHGLKVHDLARRVIVEPQTPEEIVRYLDAAAS